MHLPRLLVCPALTALVLDFGPFCAEKHCLSYISPSADGSAGLGSAFTYGVLGAIVAAIVVLIRYS